jgi:hypothetical protein
MITDGITSANINNSKYLFIIDDGSIGVDDDVVDSVVVLAAFCILNPKINDDVPIKKETIVRTFCVRPGMMATGAPRLVCCCVCCCCCCCALTVFMSMDINDTDSKIIVNVNKNKHNMLTRLGNNLVMIIVTSNNNPTLLMDTETH